MFEIGVVVEVCLECVCVVGCMREKMLGVWCEGGSMVVECRQGPVIAQLVERLTVVESLALVRVQKSNGHRFDSG